MNRNLPTFHRYLKLRQRILGVDELHYYDLSAPLAVAADRQFTFAEAREHILAACKPLGNDYVSMVRKAFADRWIDAYPTAGKRPGGYANGWAYDVHPYILFNFDGDYDDMSGLAHELGHALQSYLSNRNQPFAMAQCPRFVTEVASTLNEALLVDSMLKQTRDDDERLSMLGNYLDGFAIKIFRATQISEFELRAHEMAEKGEPLTGEALNGLYLEIARKYYGHDQNVCIVDDAMPIGLDDHSPVVLRLLRLPVRNGVHGFYGVVGAGAERRQGGAKEISRFPLFRRIGLFDPAAEKGRGRHDSFRAV